MGDARAKGRERLGHVMDAPVALCPNKGRIDGHVRLAAWPRPITPALSLNPPLRSSSLPSSPPSPPSPPPLSSASPPFPPYQLPLQVSSFPQNPRCELSSLIVFSWQPHHTSCRMQSPSRHTLESPDSDSRTTQPNGTSYLTQNIDTHHMQSHTDPPFTSVLAPAPTLTFDSHLHPHGSAAMSSSARPSQLARANSLPNNGTLNLDPVPGDPGTTFIRPPFTDFPGSENYKGGLTYSILATNAEWFLDVKDFIGPNSVAYPTQLEPPRGWCPAKKKDVKDGWKEGEEPRLRCTFCRRTYAGVNAKSMWRRHVYEKHKVPMANRRETGEKVGGRGGRSSNST